MIDFVTKAGPLIYPLGLCSILAATITIERLYALRRRRVIPREITEVVESLRSDLDPTLALEVCKRNPGVFSNVIRKGLELTGEQWEIIRDGVLDAGRQETATLERHLVWLQTIAQAAPLLGLLGTVLGMIKVFAAITISGLGDPQALSEGISEAMITTAVGLAIGIPTLVAFNLLTARADSLIMEIEAYAGGLVERLRHSNCRGAAS